MITFMKKESSRSLLTVVLLLLFGVFLILTACAPTGKEILPSEKNTIAEKVISLPPLDSQIATLLNKNKDATNYNYFYDSEKAEGYAVYRVGNKVKKVYAEPLKMGSTIFLNVFYLDFEKKTAFGVCDKLGISCTEQWNKAYPLDFSSQKLALSPLDLASAIPPTAKKVGGENVDGRSTEIIEYINAEGKLERLSLDKFYGLPLKQVVFSSTDSKSEVQVKHTYFRLAVNQLKESDVALPEGVDVVQ